MFKQKHEMNKNYITQVSGKKIIKMIGYMIKTIISKIYVFRERWMKNPYKKLT